MVSSTRQHKVGDYCTVNKNYIIIVKLLIAHDVPTITTIEPSHSIKCGRANEMMFCLNMLHLREN